MLPCLSRKPPKDRKAQTEKIIKDQRSFQQPRTIAEAEATQVKMVDGTVKSAVASELWSTLSVREGADGKMEIVETDDCTPLTNAAAIAGNIALPVAGHWLDLEWRQCEDQRMRHHH